MWSDLRTHTLKLNGSMSQKKLLHVNHKDKPTKTIKITLFGQIDSSTTSLSALGLFFFSV